MADPAESTDPAEMVERLNQLAADGPSDEDTETAKRLALALAHHYHDRINDRYYEQDLSDAEAEARTLENAGVSPAGIALAMTATGRDDVSERTVATYLQ